MTSGLIRVNLFCEQSAFGSAVESNPWLGAGFLFLQYLYTVIEKSFCLILAIFQSSSIERVIAVCCFKPCCRCKSRQKIISGIVIKTGGITKFIGDTGDVAEYVCSKLLSATIKVMYCSQVTMTVVAEIPASAKLVCKTLIFPKCDLTLHFY